MRIDPRPTVAGALPAFRAYRGAALGTFIGGHLTDEHVAACATAAVEAGDREGLRLARLLVRFSKKQRYELRRRLRLGDDSGLTRETIAS